MVNLDISCFQNSVDLDQLASEKPADQGPHCFPVLIYLYILETGILQVNWMIIGEECKQIISKIVRIQSCKMSCSTEKQVRTFVMWKVL